MRHGFYAGFIKSDIGFYIGDVCYALSDKMYHEVWGGKYHFDDGCFEVMDSGFSFAVGSTANGDGCYVDEHGNKYPVDAGNIGIVPLELVAKPDAEKLGSVIKVPGKAHYTFANGVFIFSVPTKPDTWLGKKYYHIDTEFNHESEYDEEGEDDE